jgi:selenophosphate synthase
MKCSTRVAEPDADTFWVLVRRYRALGLDPLKWIAGCSVEVDREEVVFPALSSARDALAALGATVHPRQGPDVFELRGAPAETSRVVVRPGAGAARVRTARRANPQRAALVARVFQRRTDSPEAFGAALVEAVAALPPTGGNGVSPVDLEGPLTIGCLHAVATPLEDAQFASFEIYNAGSGRARGHNAVACESLQVTDSTLDPLAQEHAAIVTASALSGLLALGVTDGLSIAPVFDAAGRKACDAVAANFQAAARDQQSRLLERGPLGTGKLFVGAVAAGHTERAVPNRHQYVKRGMQVTLTRPLGELAPLAAYLSCLSDADYLTKLDASGLTLDDLARARNDTVRALSTPPREAGEVIGQFSPPFDEPPDLRRHLAATEMVGRRGVFALLDLARRLDVDLRLREVPMANAEIAAFATSAFLVDNATATTPGAIAIIAYPSVLNEVDRALEAKGVTPSRVGEVLGRGAALRVAPSTAANIASKRMLGELVVEEAAGAKAAGTRA